MNINEYSQSLDHLHAIDLQETLSRAALLQRLDRKYVVNLDSLSEMIYALMEEYKVLVIENVRAFKYLSCYYDDNSACYLDHHRGKRRRFKVRTRQYLDSDQTWFEVKLKGKNGSTNKIRSRCQELVYPTLTKELHGFVKSSYESNFQKPFLLDLTPCVVVSYTRTTLVSVHHEERVTIDTNLSFRKPTIGSETNKFGSKMAVVEVKSDGKKRALDRVLSSYGYKPEEKMSKYCLSKACIQPYPRRNNFLPTLKKLQKRGFLAKYW